MADGLHERELDGRREAPPELPFAADGTAARTHLALKAALDSDFANFDDHSARHKRA